MDRLSLGQAALAEENPRLIYCSITSFGEDSPLSRKPAIDIVAQALSRVMSVDREADQASNKLGLPMADMAGSIFAVFGILAALDEGNATGRGWKVEVVMIDSLIGMLGSLSRIYIVSRQAPQPVGTKHPSVVPYGASPTRDNHVIVACPTEGSGAPSPGVSTCRS